jgi:hypothetical protein
MAFTKALVGQTVFGNKRFMVYSMTADAATDSIATDLGSVEYCFHQAQSFTSTGGRHLVADAGASGTSIAGTIGASGFVSGDVFTLFAIGR